MWRRTPSLALTGAPSLVRRRLGRLFLQAMPIEAGRAGLPNGIRPMAVIASRADLHQRRVVGPRPRALVYHAVWPDAQGKDCVKEVSMVKALCGELVNEVLYDCQQFHGGFGYMREATIERMVRDARVEAIGGGATEVMLEEVAKRL
jgi:alkylation response protein AidB-like acyl-CoA dehydrogenase